MKKNGNIYTARKGCFIVRKADGAVMGERIDLGSADSIGNYKDEAYTKESYKAFYESLDSAVPATGGATEEERMSNP